MLSSSIDNRAAVSDTEPAFACGQMQRSSCNRLT
jgi:hypothetical protein